MSTLLHVFKYAPGRGGMDNLQKLHLSHGDGDEKFLVLARRPDDATSDAGGPWTSWSRLRKRFSAEVNAVNPRVTVYYNCWGADRLSDLDTARWRIGYLHSDFPHFENYIRHFGQHLNGFLCVSEGLVAKVRRCLPHLPPEHVQCAPIMGPAVGSAAGGTKSRDFVIGYAGRLVRDQKPVDRLPAFIRELDAQGLRDWRLEILGEGPERGALEKGIGIDSRVLFRGWCDAEATRTTMETWRYQITVSDYEGLSIALLEAAAAGCLPVYPQFNDEDSESDLPASVAPFCLYKTGDMAEVVKKIADFEKLRREAPDQAATMFQELAAFAAMRTPENYLDFWARWRRRMFDEEPATLGRSKPPAGQRIEPVWCYNRRYRALVQGR